MNLILTSLVWGNHPFHYLTILINYARPCSLSQSSAIAATRSYKGPDPSTPSGVIRKNENQLYRMSYCGWLMEELPESGGRISRNSSFISRVIIWLLLSIIVDFLGLYSTSGSGWDSASVIRQSLGEISSTMMIGVLFFLGAGLLLSSQSVRNPDETEKWYLLKPFIMFLLLTVIYLLIRPFIVFNVYEHFGDSSAIIDSGYIYSAMLAAPFGSFVFCSLGGGLAALVDDWRITTIVGCSLFVVVNLFLGMPHAPSRYPELSLFSPSHFYRAIILTLSGLYTLVPLSIQNWAGISPFNSIVAPSIVYIILTSISIWSLLYFGKENRQRCQLLRKSNTIQVTEQEQRDETKLGYRLKTRRKAVLVCFVVFGLLIPLGGYSYTSNRAHDVLTVIYEGILQPTNGELYYGSFNTEVLPPDISQWIGFPMDIIDWGQCPSPITFEYVVRDGSIAEFSNMNESERWWLSYTTSLDTDQIHYFYNSYHGLDELEGPHYWVFRFYSNDWTSEQSGLRIRISVVLREMSDI